MPAKRRFFLFPAGLIIIALACIAPFTFQNTSPDPIATLNALYTAAAQTIEGGTTPVTQSSPTASLTPLLPTFPVATATQFRTPAPVVRCDAAAFVKDVTIADGTALARGTAFTKTWRLQNAGTCSWTSAYALVFVSGDRMGAPSAVALTGNVNPGQTVDLSVNLTAPNKDSHYRGYWKLRNASSILFGLGPQADTAFWVDINVTGPAFVAYDFAVNYCSASWQNNNRDLPCPGAEGDDKGYVLRLNSPQLENGKTEDEPGLLTYPKSTSNGYISGKFPALRIQNGDRFTAWVNCQYKSSGCDVIFRLDYQIDGGEIKTLGKWHEVYEGQYYRVNIDLSPLAGQKVKFILVVTANGSAYHDYALWFAPRIIRQGTPPATSTLPPSATPTPTSASVPPLEPPSH